MERPSQKQWIALALAFCMMKDREENTKVWSRPWLQRRHQESVYFRLVKELTLEDPNALREWIRLDRTQYQHYRKRRYKYEASSHCWRAANAYSAIPCNR